MSSPTDTLETRLEEWLSSCFGGAACAVTALRRLSGGSSRENWAFDASIDGHDPRPLLLRRDPIGGVADTDRALEVGVLNALAEVDLATPVILAADLSGRILDRPAVVMERSPGRADRSVLRSRDPLALGSDGQLALATTLATMLAALHGIPVDDALVAACGAVPDDPGAHEIARWESEIERADIGAQPELAYTAAWLSEHRPSPPDRPTLVHGDFRPANVLVNPLRRDDEGRAEVVLLDWEFAHLGDPVEDIGWYTTPIYRGEHFIAGAWEPVQFLGRYGARRDIDVATIDPRRLHFWQVFALFKLGVIAHAGAASFIAGDTDRASGPPTGFLRTMVAATRSTPGVSAP